jgi:chitodextrinase
MTLKQHLKYLCFSSIVTLLLVGSLSADETLKAKFKLDPKEGPTPLEVQLDASSSIGEIEEYKWSSGDKKEAGKKSKMTFETVGDHEIQLVVIDAEGNADTATETVIVLEKNTPPVADFTYTVTPEKGPVPFTVSLDASNSTDEDGEISSYEWKSSDGQTASGEQAELIFPTEGEYTISLTVTDDQDATAESTQILNLESWVPEFIYNSIARAYPQVIAAGVSPSVIDAFDDSEFDVVAIVRPGVLDIKNISFERVEKTQSLFGGLKQTMTLAGVLANGDEIYKFTYIFERGQFKDFVLKTAWGSKTGQFNIVAKDRAQNKSHTYPYLMVGNYPIQKAKTQSEKPVNYNKTKRFGPQMIMAGYSPAKLDYSDEEFDIIAVVRAGELPIKQVVLKNNSGAFDSKMEQAGELSNGDKIYKMTFTYPRGALGKNESIDYKDLWGPSASQFGIEVIDQAQQRSHKFPNIEFGNFPEMK